MITDQDIREAEAQVAAARERGARAKMAARDDVHEMIGREVARLTELREAKQRQDEGLKTRKVAERQHASELKAMGAELDSSAQTVDKARKNAARALEELISALRGHNTAVGEAHSRLAALGLPLGDEAVDQYDTGAGHAGALRVAGTTWASVPEDAMVAHVVAEVMKREFGAQHPAARVRDVRVHSLVRGSAGALKVA